jgi:DNA-directed RNA polymerase subunit RPC12/RpoP
MRRTKIGDNALATRSPSVARQWDRVRNGKARPQTISASSHKKYWWRCRRGHVWEAAVSSRTKGHGCPYCSGRLITKEKSLASVAPKLAKQWHPVRNGDLTPFDIGVGSHEMVWWKCPKGPDHEWRALVHARSRGIGCPYCNNRRASVTNSVAATMLHLAAEWHPKNRKTPAEVSVGSEERILWKCPRGSDHEWFTKCCARTKNGLGCPFCSSHRVSVTNCLATRAPVLARQWHPTKNGRLAPSDVIAGARRKVWWLCVAGHEWQARCSNRFRLHQGCPICRTRPRKIATKRVGKRHVHLPSYDGPRARTIRRT